MSKILIIEDEAAIRRVLVKILSEENDTYKVEEAEDGLAGIDKIKKEDFDNDFRINFSGAVNCIQSTLNLLKKSSGSLVLSIAEMR